MSFIAACVQTTATTDVHHDIRVLTDLIRDAAGRGARFVATPEYCAGLDTRDGKMFPVAFAACVGRLGDPVRGGFCGG